METAQALYISGKRFKIVQHFHNSRNLGESWHKTLQRMFMGWQLTDMRYAQYLDSLMNDNEFLSIEETNEFLRELGILDDNYNLITETGEQQ